MPVMTELLCESCGSNSGALCEAMYLYLLKQVTEGHHQGKSRKS